VDFLDTPVGVLAEQVRAGSVAARELVTAALDRIERIDEEVHAFVAVDAEAALAEAHAIDERVAAGEDAGPLAGIPLAVKDLEPAIGFVTSQGSTALAEGRPASHDSELVARLRAAGCIVIGKTNTPAFGHKPDTTNLVFPATRNPWDLARSPGGSSGGSAAALAAGMVPLATGSDGGGSIRIPSAVCGLSGMKPSLGRVPGDNAWHDLSISGPMARRIGDIALALDTVIGPDPSDLRSLPMPEASWSGAVVEPHVPLRVAWSPTLGFATPSADVLAVCERAVLALEDAGAEVVRVDDVFTEDPLMTWVTLVAAYLVRSVEAHGAHADADEPSLAVYLDLGRSLGAGSVVAAIDACHDLNRRLVRLFADHRVLVTPTTATTAPLSGEQLENWVQYTYPFNLTRSPAGTVFAGLAADGLPVGLQVVGPQHGDQVVLRTLAALEAMLGLAEPPRH
jgi:aspartyl-tRNA(Asn)/glutamyl-tRNA(Gln) amidotransferase subunit A